MSTTQKRGFRLPWSSDPEPEDGSGDSERTAELLAASGSGTESTPAGSHDLGEGPFKAVPLESEDGMAQWKAAAGKSEAVVLESVVQHRAGKPEDMEAAGSPELAQNDDAGGWPTSDHYDPANHGAGLPATAPASSPRRESPLVAGLVKAMREAAETSRSETIATLRDEATAQVETIRSSATDEAEALRQQADADIDGIRDWAKTETARIKQESEQRVVDRRETLERELEDHANDVDALAAQVEAAVAAYEKEMESFFERLLAESDPARLATLAERAPEPPILSELPAVQRVTANGHAEIAVADAGANAATDAPTETDTETDLIGEAQADAAVAETSTGPETPDADADGADMLESDEPEATATGVATETDDMATGSDPAASYDETEDDSTDEALAPEAAAAAEAEAFEGLGTPTDADDDGATPADAVYVDEDEVEAQPRSSDPGRQRVIVVGLATVAGISAFKSALGQLGGVNNVSVMAGDPGSFVFTVLHDPALDLRPVLPELPGFEAQITADDGDTIHVAAREPAA
jgi:hypothetical protein